MNDLRYAFRQLLKNPCFTAVAVLTLGLGIGANVSIFSIVNAVLLRPLPFRDPDRLVWIANNGDGGLSGLTSRVGNFNEWRKQNQSFERLGAYFAFFDYFSYTLTSDGDPARLQGVGVSEGFLGTLGVQPTLGRGFSADECKWNGPKAVLLTDRFWRGRFGASRDIVGHSITLNNEAWTVVGVLPSSFDFTSIFVPASKVDLVVPFPTTEETDRWGNTLAVVGRLKPGVTLQKAQSEFTVLSKRIQSELHRDPFGAQLTPLSHQISGQFRRPFVVLICAVGCVLLIACANLSNLLLARATARRKELSVRIALGASRTRLIRQMLTESLLMAFCGALAGMPLAYLATGAIAQSNAFNIPMLRAVSVDGVALGFALLITMVTGLAFGIVPALQGIHAGLRDDLKDASRGSSAGKRRVWMREALVVSEVALACVLLVGAGLLIRSFIRLVDINPGFRPEQAGAWPIQPSRSFANDAERTAFYKQLVQRVESIPGVESAGLSDSLPLGRNRSWRVVPRGGTYHDGDDAFVRIVDAGYIKTMCIPLRSGREFDTHDNSETEKVMIINEAMARRMLPGRNPLGQVMVESGTEFRVIGVVGNVHHSALEEDAGSEMYLLGAQKGWSSEELVVRTKSSLKALVPAVRALLREIDPRMPASDFRSLGQIVDQAVSPKRLITLLLGLFSVLALLLASVGIYGVIGYSVTQRTSEFGIRLALGATHRDIVGLVVRRGMVPVASGLVVGLLTAVFLTGFLRSLLFGISATDPLTFISYSLLLAAVALFACWIPARTAAKLDPMVALRHE
jgi:putative ABC transport system permease protein